MPLARRKLFLRNFAAKIPLEIVAIFGVLPHEVNQLNRLKLLLSNAPVGNHPDEVEQNMIRMPDGTLVEAEIRFAAGATDTDPAGEAMQA